MPKWENNFLKIHEGCGGLVYWREAIHTPSVGYFGKCRDCTVDQIPVEQIIPIDITEFDDEAVKLHSEVENDRLDELSWDDNLSWEKNQENLQETLREKVRQP